MKKLLVLLSSVLLLSNSFAQNYQWAKGIEGTGKSRAIAADGTGNVYIKGTFVGTCDFDPSPTTVNITAVTSADIYIAKYNSSGNYLWAISIGATIDDNTDNVGRHYIAVDDSGNVYITGHFRGTADFDPDTATANLTSVGFADIFFAKYDANGNYIWAKSIGSINPDNGLAIFVDDTGNVYIGGSFSGTADFDPGPDTANIIPVGNNPLFFAKYDANGNYLWAKQVGSQDNNSVMSLSVDPSGNIHITGFFTYTADFDPGPDTANLTAANMNVSVFVAKYDNNGNYLWANKIGGGAACQGQSIALDASGNIFVTGYFTFTDDYDPGPDTANLTPVGGNDIFFAKYDTSGNYIWAKSIGSINNDGSNDIVVDGTGSIYIEGNFMGTVDFDPDTGTANLTSASAGQWDFYFAKYDTNGNYIWAKSIGGISNDIVLNMALDIQANIYITGYFDTDTLDFDPGLGTANLFGVGGDNIFFAKYSQPCTPYIPTYTDTIALILHDGINCIDYPIVKIGSQWWMAENVNATLYADSTSLVDGTGAGDITGNYTTKYYFNYADNPVNGDIYGKLYTWQAAMNGAASSDSIPSGVQGVCPSGWHLPSDAEWCTMENTVEAGTDPGCSITGWRGTNTGGDLKETGTTHWLTPNTGATNASGFTALPGGQRSAGGSFFSDVSNDGLWLTATEISATTAWCRSLHYSFVQVERRSVTTKDFGISVRCVKDIDNLINLTISITDSTNVTCYALANGSATATATGGTTPYTYSWNTLPVQTDSVATGLAAGTYTVTVTDSSSNTATDSVTITEPSIIQSSASDTICQGDSVQLPNGAWATAAGTYYDTLSALNGCDSVIVTALTVNPKPVINTFTVTSIGCTPLNNTICGTATGATIYIWDYDDGGLPINGTSDSCLTYVYLNTIGTPVFYDPTLIVENSDGCSDTATATVTVLPSVAAAFTASPDTAGCHPFTVDFINSSTGASNGYLWDFGDGSPAVNDTNPTHIFTNTASLVDSIYTVRLIATGFPICKDTAVQQILVHPTPTASITGTDLSCTAANDGAADLTASGGAPLSYNWSNGDTTEDIMGLSVGTYTVIVTDTNGCTDTATAIVGSLPEMTLAITPTDATCGNPDGSASVTVTNGGTPPYSYSWSSGDTLPDADSLASGIYIVTVTDTNGCSSFALATISDANGPVINIITTTNITCNGGSDGVIGVNVTGGTTPYTLQWSNGSTSNIIFNLVAGPYELTVTDFAGCIANKSVTLIQPDALSLLITTTDAICSNNNGSATVNVSGGNGGYTYSWSNGGTASTDTGLAADVYTVTVTDVSGCKDSASAAVSNIGGPAITIDSIIDGGCGADLGSIYISVTGGSGDYTYLWSNSSAAQDLVGVSSGTYSVTVTDTTNSCIATVSAHIAGVPATDASICLVTVDSATGSNLVVWEKLQTQGVQSYNIYRESSQAGIYYLIGNVPVDSVSVFTDTLSNPLQQAYRYRISVVDSCGNESEKSQLHKTMHLTINEGLGGVINLIWDHYEGFGFLTYYIHRYTTSTGWVEIDSIASTLTSRTDFSPPPANLSYRIVVKRPAGCDPNLSKVLIYNSARSNVSNRLWPTGILPQVPAAGNLTGFNVYPNPYTGTTVITYTLNDETDISLEVLNVLGKKIQVLVNGEQDIGKYRYSFSAKDLGYSSGVYILKLIVGDGVYTKQLVEF